MKFENANVLITGGASGIGKIMGRMALEKGAGCLIIWDINLTAIEAARTELGKIGRVKGYVVDVSNNAIVEVAYSKTVADCGDIDILINCAGIESPGLTSAPAIGEYVAELVSSLGFSLVPKKSFNGTRRSAHWFRHLTEDEKNEVIKKEPAYGRIICRCELVTEGEIVDAIRTNPRPHDLDGVKRRTRATMGRCQGGFCSPYIVELLAREENCSVLDVTKSGGKSYINLSKTKEALK